ncbi:hypothetical protein [Roseivivax sediminis]|uniref:SGNH hydrolase-like domain-containing protein, acetyltransferase AlgX n=1 Tax=Roseivivax sediminis TaxID=936889 RepID=A0A1I1WU55_9RHOB|nr:hypothetical protein [Roseivivax sediminis]SFD98572.1 hypothetical protein SAMN04515678_10598 [Roseivivax sediminis]
MFSKLGAKFRPEVENDVLIGRNGTLFIHQGGHKLYDQAQGKRPLKPLERDAFARNLEERRAYCDERRVRYAHLLSPDKQVVMAEDHPVRNLYSIGAAVREELDTPFIWPAPYLGREDYFVTDSHWNTIGQLKVAEAFLCEIGLAEHAPTVGGWREELVERSYNGDLGLKLKPARSEMASFMPPNHATTQYHNGLEPAGNEGTVRAVVNSDPLVRQTLLVFGTSSTQIMLPILGRIFEVTVHCRARFMHREIVDMVRPDVVLTQNQERYFWETRSDKNALPFFMIPHVVGRVPKYSDKALEVLGAIFTHGSLRHDAMMRMIRNGKVPGANLKRIQP